MTFKADSDVDRLLYFASFGVRPIISVEKDISFFYLILLDIDDGFVT